MDFVNLGGKLLQSVRSGRVFSILGSQPDHPEVPARAAAAAAAARTLAGLPPHQRLTLPSTSGGTPSLYGARLQGEKPEDIDEKFYEKDFDPVKHVLENLPEADVDQKYFEPQVARKLLQLDSITERLSRKVMEHHEEMVKGAQLVMELEKDLQVTTIICKNGRRKLSSAGREVSQDLVVTSNVKRKQALLDILAVLAKVQQALDMKSRLDNIAEEGNYAKALQMCSICMQVIDECSGISAIADMNNNIEEWLHRTLEKVDGVLMQVCRNFEEEKYKMVIDAYAMIDDGGLEEKVQNSFVQIVVSETHAILKSFLYEGEESHATEKKSRLPYNDLCLQLPESKFRHCLRKTLEALFDLMSSYYTMMTWQVPTKEGDAGILEDKLVSSLNGKHKRSGSCGSFTEPHETARHNRTASLSSFEPDLHANHRALQLSYNVTRSPENLSPVVEDSVGKDVEAQTRLQLEPGDQRVESLFVDHQDLARNLDDAVNGNTLRDVTERLRLEAACHVSRALEKGRKHVWELTARRVSALLSSDVACATSPHHFLQILDWINGFVLAGEAFSGAEAVSLRAKLVKLCERYFGGFHRQNLEVIRGMLEKEQWHCLSPSTAKTLNLASLLGTGVAASALSPVILPRGPDSKGFDMASLSKLKQGNSISSGKHDPSGFSIWLERGNPFTDKTIDSSLLAKEASVQGSANAVNKTDARTMALAGSPDSGSSKHCVQQFDDFEDEDEELLADYIDEDSQKPSRLNNHLEHGNDPMMKDMQVNAEAESLVLTMSSLSILRFMDRYARMMQVLQPITIEIARGLFQLFELYFYSIFKTFGQGDAFGSSRGQGDFSNMLTPRLRATLVRISQGLEEQRPKSAGGTTVNQMSSNMASSHPNLLEGTQRLPNLSSMAASFSPNNLYGLKERYAAVESLSSLAQVLTRSRPHLQSMVFQDAFATIENFYTHIIEVVPELKEHVYRTVARLLLNISGYVDRIANVKWELKELGMEHNGYVDLLLGEYRQFSHRLAYGGLTNEIHELLLEYGVDVLAEILLEGFSRVRKCTNEGRALMSLDLQVLINGLRHLAPARLGSNLHSVEAFVKAFYLPETEYIHWIRAHPEYTKAQVIGLINLVASTNNWKRKTKNDLIEKIEVGEL